jgi:hypothetical protein
MPLAALPVGGYFIYFGCNVEVVTVCIRSTSSDKAEDVARQQIIFYKAAQRCTNCLYDGRCRPPADLSVAADKLGTAAQAFIAGSAAHFTGCDI